MISKTNEQALEAQIEKALTGTCQELQNKEANSVGEPNVAYQQNNGFETGEPHDFDPNFAIDKRLFWQFLEQTQESELTKLQRNADWKKRILNRFHNLAKKNGILTLLKSGLKVEDAELNLFYQLDKSGSETANRKFNQNIFSVTRQVQYNIENRREEIDMVLFINGIPISTLELKNQWTGQTALVQGQKQYKEDRDTNQTLLNFGRCLVHFAVDTDEVYMTTKLNGKSTFFLPFNQGNNKGKGNPVNPNGHRTEYLWKELFQKESLANIIQHFVRFDGKPKDKLASKTLFFPRYHQRDVVNKLVADIESKGVGETYLIQHSAGSGKSNSITWLAYQLIGLYPKSDQVKGFKAEDLPLFNSVVVVTDRRLLDKQIKKNIKAFSEVKNIVAHAHNSGELKKSLEEGKRIVITTIQKFPFILDEISDLSSHNFAVIIDEAHSSQGGTVAGKMNQAMGAPDEIDNKIEEEEDAQDKIVKAMKARKMKGNASYFAFTATPKNATLEKFGTQQTNGSFLPFHLYSMKQAIEEGFILDVLSNYTTYKSYYELHKSVEENPEFSKSKAQKKLKAWVEKDKHTINVKASVMLDHFISKVVNPKKLKSKAKAMVVTQSIPSAIRYYQALNKLLKAKGNPFKIAIAFSGSKTVDGFEWDELSLNNFPESLDTDDKSNPDYIEDKIARYFNKDEYRILVVANKFLTGFDQPKLSAMYVDKKLQGVLAVQALSRLNRSAPKLGKRTGDLFVLDFFNEVDDIKKSFDPFYTSTSLKESTDVNVLHELKDQLNAVAVYEWSEVQELAEKYYKGVESNELSALIDVGAERFNNELELEDAEKADFKIKAKQFVKIYSQVASIIPYEFVDWEMLYWYLKLLIPKLIVKTKEDDLLDELLNSTDMSSYGLERTKLSASIELDDEDAELKPTNANPRGAHGEDDKIKLDTIINDFNEKWFSGWEGTPEEARVKFISFMDEIVNHEDFESNYKDNKDEHTRNLALWEIYKNIAVKNRRKDLNYYKTIKASEESEQAFFELLKFFIDSKKDLQPFTVRNEEIVYNDNPNNQLR